jgi:predicted RNA binding protein YcfA (HicA-like mRNA interferase family)
MIIFVVCRERSVNWSLTCTVAGFSLVPGGKGSHRKFRHSKFSGSVIISGHDGDDARHYQEKQVRNAIRDTSK